MTQHLYNLALTIPWQITADALEAMLSMALDEPLPEEEIKRRMHGPRSLALRDGRRRDDSRSITMRDNVAILNIDGPIYRYADYFTQVSGGVTTEQLGRDFQTALDDPSVGAILFVLDSPGGEATGIGELSDAIYDARGAKPIGAYVEGFGASAAYRIASAADVLVVDDEAIVGSIGTIMGVPDPTKRPSYRIDIVSTQSPKKRPDVTTPEGRAVLQATVDRLTDVFIAKTARNRGITEAQILAVEGGVLVGQDAIAAGFADRLGSEERAVAELANRARGRKLFPVRTPGLLPFTQKQEENQMKLSEILSSVFASAKQAGIEIEPDDAPVVAPPPPVASAPTNQPPTDSSADHAAILAQRDERLKALEQALAEQKAAQVAQSAVSFADTSVRNRRAYPSEHAQLVALYVQAAGDDDRMPMADGLASRVRQLEQTIDARPPHSLSAEIVAAGAGGTLESGATPGQVSDDRKQALLAMTPLGQAALKRDRN